MILRFRLSKKDFACFIVVWKRIKRIKVISQPAI